VCVVYKLGVVTVKHTRQIKHYVFYLDEGSKMLPVSARVSHLSCILICMPDDGSPEPRHVAFCFLHLNKIPSVSFVVCA
jgi:hypothetical protein